MFSKNATIKLFFCSPPSGAQNQPTAGASMTDWQVCSIPYPLAGSSLTKGCFIMRKSRCELSDPSHAKLFWSEYMKGVK